jgi:Zn-dependent protease with chaperone function
VNLAFCLLLYSFAVSVLGPPVLRRLTGAGHAPRLGVAVWLTAIASVVLTWVAAGALVVVDVARHWNAHSVFVTSCLARLRGVVAGDAGVGWQIGLLATAAAGVVAAAVIGVRLTRTLMLFRTRAHDHAHSVRIVGRRYIERDVVVVDAERPAAYCVQGHPPTIVVTSAALAALDSDQLAAVLAHERAHLAGHHPHVVTALRSLATAFPRFPLMTRGAAEVSRLLEMCADDAATRQYGHRALLSGLLNLAGVAPAPALGAADVAVMTRIERLIVPPALPTRARASATLASIVAVLAAGPVITVALAGAGALMCGT